MAKASTPPRPAQSRPRKPGSGNRSKAQAAETGADQTGAETDMSASTPPEAVAASTTAAPAVAGADAKEAPASSAPVREDAEGHPPKAEDETPVSPPPDADTAPDTPAAGPDTPEAPQPAPPAARRGGTVPLVLGGAIAAALGFGAAQLVPQGWPVGGQEITALQGELASQSEHMQTLEAALAEVQAQTAATPDVEALTATATEAALAPLQARLDQAEQALAALEARFAASASAADAATLADFNDRLSALEATSAELQQAVADARAIAEGRATEAEAQAAAAAASAETAAERTAARLALSELAAALENGTGYGASLPALAAVADLPAALTGPAETGVASLTRLQQAYPAAARAALAAALPAVADDTFTGRIEAFLRAQLGARSLAAREGDDPDAVLSRAEAALRAGQVAAALEALAALPDAGRDAMSGWIDAAETRLAALAALAELSHGLSAPEGER